MEGPGRCAIVAIALAALCASPCVEAQSGEVQALLRRGVELRERGDDDGALAAFQQACAVGCTPRVTAQVGLAEYALGRWVDAESHVAVALQATGDAWIARHRGVLASALGSIRQHLGSLEIRGPVGATVSVGGLLAGVLPLTQPVRLAAGTVTLGVLAPGYRPVQREVTVIAGALVRETVDLVAEAPPAPAMLAPVIRPPRPLVLDTPAPGTLGRTQRVFGWTALGGAVAVLGGAVVAQWVRASQIASYNGPDCGQYGLSRMQTCSDRLDAASTAQTLAIAGYITAGALAGTATVLFLTVPSPPRVDRATLTCGDGPGTVGLHCTVEF